jgi:putative membrane protein
MKPALLALAAGALLISGTVPAVAATSSADRAFVAMVSQGGMFEVQAGQLAALRGSNPNIRDQGTEEEHDHMLVGDHLTRAAASAGIPFSTTPNAMFRQKFAMLSALSGTAFDNAFVDVMKDIHAKDGAAFAKEAATGTNPALRSFAAITHPIVVRHIGGLNAISKE